MKSPVMKSNVARMPHGSPNLVIYTDWANHYLEKARYKRFITDLQADIGDGVLLADVIEAVTNERVQDINSKPRTASQMIENISACLTFLAELGVNVEGLNAKEIKDGNLKAILGLFFSLSRFKQQQKQQQTQSSFNHNNHRPNANILSRANTHTNANTNPDMLSRLPSPFQGGGSGRCPTVNHPGSGDQGSSSSLKSNKNSSLKKGFGSIDRAKSSQANNNNSHSGTQSLGKPVSRDSGSRATSPSTGLTGIPVPGSRSIPIPGARSQSLGCPESRISRLPNSTSTSSCASSGSSSTKSGSRSQSANAAASSSAPASAPGTSPGNNKNSMLDKFKFFKDKGDKSKSSKTAKNTATAKNDVDKINGNVEAPSHGGRGAHGRHPGELPEDVGSPKMAMSGLRKSFGRSKKDSPTAPSPATIPGAREDPRRSTSASIPSRTSSSTSVSSSVSSSTGRRSASAGASKQKDQISPTDGSMSRSSKSGLTKPSSKSKGGSGLPSPVSGTMPPGMGTGIPKPGSGGRSLKPGKESDPNRSSNRLSGGSGKDAPRSTSQSGMSGKHSSSGSSSRSSSQSLPKGASAGTPPGYSSSKHQSHHGSIPRSASRDNTSRMGSVTPDPTMSGKGFSRGGVNGSQRGGSEYANTTSHGYNVASHTQQQIHRQAAMSPSRDGEQHQQQQQKRRVPPPPPRVDSQPSHQKPAKVDSDTQTSMSTMQNSAAMKMQQQQQYQQQMQRQQQQGVQSPGHIPPHMQAQSRPQSPHHNQQQRTASPASSSSSKSRSHDHKGRSTPSSKSQKSSSSLHSESNASVKSGQSESNVSSNSTSNSNNSASSNDSVIFRPSSCDELESDLDLPNSPRPARQSSQTPVAPPTDHIASLRLKHAAQADKTPRKKETTFDANGSPRDAPATEDIDTIDVDIKPMQPIMRSTPYAYLRGINNSQHLRPSIHMPSLSSTNVGMPNSASNRLGVNRPLIDPSKLYTNSMRRVVSNTHNVIDNDYGSDIDGFDVTAGYMSDGDILHSNHGEDFNSGYLSEGGATLYAKRMQQRFREGMMAVKECMQKSNAGVCDDDSFDDSSSISSGDISDTINEISTDENLTTGSSLSGTSSERTNPYGSLKRTPGGPVVPPAGGSSLNTRSLPTRSGAGKNVVLGRNINLVGETFEGPGGINWRKYAIGGDTNGAKTGDYKALGYQSAIAGMRKSSQATITDLKTRSRANSAAGVAIEDPNLNESEEGSTKKGGKVDSETNTDVMMVRKGQPGGRPQGPNMSTFFHRPASASAAQGKNNKASEAERLTGERLSNYNKNTTPVKPGMKTASGTQTSMFMKQPRQDGSTDPYGTLERKKRGMMASNSQNQMSMSGPAGHGHGQPDYSSLGRRRDGHYSQDQMGGSTIISNPHASFTKRRDSTDDSSPTSSMSAPSGRSPYVNMFLNPDMPQRPLSAMSSPTHGHPWIKSPGGVGANNGMRTTLSETESMESISSTASSIQAQIQQAKALAKASRNILQNQNHTLHRSDSFKSTKSEKMYASSHGAHELTRTSSFSQLSPRENGGQTSPTSHSSRSSSAFAYPLSSLVPGNGGLPHNGSSPYTSLLIQSKLSSSRDDDLHGSSLSLVSTSSSVQSSSEDRASAEVGSFVRYSDTCENTRGIRKLRRELDSANDKVTTLTTQLSTNAHVVAAFEQSLSNMTTRLQHLTTSAEKKESEIRKLQNQMECLKAHDPRKAGSTPGSRSNSISLSRSSSVPRPTGPETDSEWNKGETPRMTRHMSSDSMSSINSMSSACSGTSQQSSATDSDKKNKKKKNWLRSSFSKAFGGGKKKNKNGSMSDCEPDSVSLKSADMSVPNSPLMMPHTMTSMSVPTTPIRTSHHSGLMDVSSHSYGDDAVLTLQQQLHEKDMKLTDIRLEALSSAAQLEQLRESMNRMKNEMASLKADNSRLQHLVVAKTGGSLPTTPDASSPESTFDKRLSLGDSSSIELLMVDGPGDASGRRTKVSIAVSVSYSSEKEGTTSTSLFIGAIALSGKTKWDMLDSIVRRIFKDYCMRVDPVSNLGLQGDSVNSYHIGDQITRSKDSELPELLPCGYLVGDNTTITLTLQSEKENSIDLLSFESLIPKSIVQRYISLLLEHRRIILCGPSGTGKTYLAQKLAQYLVLKAGKDVSAGAIATFNVDHKSSKELRQYLANIAEQCEHSASDLPTVIILDNLHHVGSLAEVFNGFLSVKYQECPYIIGTMNQATCSTTNLQLHHNFRWVLCANHMEPVKGFLARYLRRKVVEKEVETGRRNNDLIKIIDWLPKIWQHINKFLETHGSSDVTVGPRLFLSCPMNVGEAMTWFNDLWNYSLVPYLLEAAREGITLYGKRAPWEDPCEFVRESYPWPPTGEPDFPSLLSIRPEDVGYDSSGPPSSAKEPKSADASVKASDSEGDPLMNMLMKLQEAASYSGTSNNESDSASQDSHSVDSASLHKPTSTS